jgi:hypothetical protein
MISVPRDPTRSTSRRCNELEILGERKLRRELSFQVGSVFRVELGATGRPDQLLASPNMSNAFSRLSSRRGFLFMGIVAAVGAFPGCGDSSMNEVQEPAAKGNRNRLDMLGEKSQALIEKNKKKKRR